MVNVRGSRGAVRSLGLEQTVFLCRESLPRVSVCCVGCLAQGAPPWRSHFSFLFHQLQHPTGAKPVLQTLSSTLQGFTNCNTFFYILSQSCGYNLITVNLRELSLCYCRPTIARRDLPFPCPGFRSLQAP